jgi:hypothetical protein
VRQLFFLFTEILISFRKEVNEKLGQMMEQIAAVSAKISRNGIKMEEAIQSLAHKLENLQIEDSTCAEMDEGTLEALHTLPTQTVTQLTEFELELSRNVEYRRFMVSSCTFLCLGMTC